MRYVQVKYKAFRAENEIPSRFVTSAEDKAIARRIMAQTAVRLNATVEETRDVFLALGIATEGDGEYAPTTLTDVGP